MVRFPKYANRPTYEKISIVCETDYGNPGSLLQISWNHGLVREQERLRFSNGLIYDRNGYYHRSELTFKPIMEDDGKEI